MEHFKFDLPERPLMNFKAKIISTSVSFHPYNIPGKPDRRFKSGWREYPSIGQNIELKFVIELNERFYTGHIWRIGDFGRFRLVALDRVSNSVTFLQCQLNQIPDRSFIIPSEINLWFMGSVVGEGSYV